MSQKPITLKDLADEYLKIDSQIASLTETNKTNLGLILDLEKKKGGLFMTVAQKVDELSVPKNRSQRRREAKKK